MSQSPHDPEGTPEHPGTSTPAPPPDGDAPAAGAGAPSQGTSPGSAAPGYSPPPGSAAPGYGPPPSYGAAPPAPPGGPAPLGPSEERTWGMLAHLSALIGLFIGFSFLGPLIIYLIYRDRSQYVRRQSAEALNFNLTILIALLVSLALIIILIGFVLMAVVAVFWLVEVIIASLAANDGREHRYPLTIRFVS